MTRDDTHNGEVGNTSNQPAREWKSNAILQNTMGPFMFSNEMSAEPPVQIDTHQI